jgi:tRNA A-37 threonylcarbamoyl transferase component Bud32
MLFMNQEKVNYLPVDNLRRKLAGCHLTTSPLAPDFSLDRLLSQIAACRIIKDNDRRQVYYLETPAKGYFLKFGTLARRKDQWRHFILPFRKWSEWHNLHRLLNAGIAAAKPVLKGEDKTGRPHHFFLLTEQIPGAPLKIDTAGDMRRMGEYAARLHSNGVYHTDLHSDNIIMTPEGNIRLIDVQQLFLLPWLPRRLRVSNLGKIYFNLGLGSDRAPSPEEFIAGYNTKSRTSIGPAELEKAARRHQHKKYNSRSKRCCRNSSEFMVVNNAGWKGYKRKSFDWEIADLRRALEKGQPLKGSHVMSYQGVCIKIHQRRIFHQNRCLTSWEMSRSLDVRGITVPRALGYFEIDKVSCFVSELLDDRLHLNTYLSSITDERTKRRALKKLALWLRKFYDTRVWQRDFKSENILCREGEYYMLDLDGVKIRPLSEKQKITNLAQLNASLSNAVTLKDRLRFYYYLTAGQNPSRQQRRTVYRRVWDITRTKGTANYDLDIDLLWKPGR